mmetsp:Transcript_5633/g.19119  ORF Transcript_5633/g.19119 Transcript_5633/m.19119 type:complete len:296 (+) Transcript_5633:373-1260(+)
MRQPHADQPGGRGRGPGEDADRPPAPEPRQQPHARLRGLPRGGPRLRVPAHGLRQREQSDHPPAEQRRRRLHVLRQHRGGRARRPSHAGAAPPGARGAPRRSRGRGAPLRPEQGHRGRLGRPPARAQAGLRDGQQVRDGRGRIWPAPRGRAGHGLLEPRTRRRGPPRGAIRGAHRAARLRALPAPAAHQLAPRERHGGQPPRAGDHRAGAGANAPRQPPQELVVLAAGGPHVRHHRPGHAGARAACGAGCCCWAPARGPPAAHGRRTPGGGAHGRRAAGAGPLDAASRTCAPLSR